MFHLKKVDWPVGHVTYASSFLNRGPFSVLSYEKVKDWKETDRDLYLSSQATFSISDLKKYLKNEPYRAMVLTPRPFGGGTHGRAQRYIRNSSKTVSHYIELKGPEPSVDSYSAFFDNLRKATGLAEVLKAKGFEIIIFCRSSV